MVARGRSEHRGQLDRDASSRADEEYPAVAGGDISPVGKILCDEPEDETRTGELVRSRSVEPRKRGDHDGVVTGREPLSYVDNAACSQAVSGPDKSAVTRPRPLEQPESGTRPAQNSHRWGTEVDISLAA